MPDLLTLAARVEAAAEGSRELDALIWCALNGKRYTGHNPAYSSYGRGNPETQVEFTEPPRRTRCVTGNVRYPHAQPWTTSLDAAVKLIPDGSAWAVLMEALKRCSVSNEDEADFRRRLPAFVTAAALKARAAK